MRLDYVHVHQFGGLTDRRLDFTAGLSAVVGENDQGKSTLFYAILHALLTSTRLTKPKFRDKIERFVPLGDADHASVELGFTAGDDAHVLRKTWSTDKDVRGASLKVKGGTELSSDESVADKLAELLPAAPGTIASILMTFQAGLANTDEIDQESLHTLDDLLRASMSQAGGVSPARFEDALGCEIAKLSSRWDFDLERPEGGREHDNPWKRDVGEILAAYYLKSEACEQHEQAFAREQKIDELTQRFTALQQALVKVEIYLGEHAEAFEALSSREALTARVDKLQLQLSQTKELYSRWLKKEQEASALKIEVPQLEKTEAEARQKRGEAEKARKTAKARAQLEEAKKRQAALTDMKEQLAAAPQVTPERLGPIEKACEAVTRTEAQLGSGKLALMFAAKKDQELQIVRDLDPADTRRVFAHKSLDVEAGGRITLEHPDWAMTVTSGTGDFAALADEHRSAKAEQERLLSEVGAEDVEAARAAHHAFAELTTRHDAAVAELQRVLNGASLDELRREAGDFDVPVDPGDIDRLIEEHTSAKNELENKRGWLETLTAKIEKWKETHGSQEAVLDSIATLGGDAKRLGAERDALPAPPEGTTDESFGEAYRDAKERRETLREEKAALHTDLEVERERLGEVSSEELAAEAQSATRAYDNVLRRGRALLRIQEAMQEISDADDAIYDTIRADIEKLVADLSIGRYEAIGDDEQEDGSALPQSFVRSEDDIVVPLDIMSHGMRDAVALACRVAMARYFLQDAAGFLIMDDPLVNLDPVRQKKAAAILRRISEEKQTIVFTCHESHAEALGAKIVPL